MKKKTTTTTEDGKPSTTKHAFSCPDQLNAFKTLLENMATKADKYISTDGSIMVLRCHTETRESIWDQRIISVKQT